MTICGTDESSWIWCNVSDSTGIVFASIVWLFFIFAVYVVVDISLDGYVDLTNGLIISFLMLMSMWSHLKTMLSDPGSVPANAHPLKTKNKSMSIAMCGRCDGFKPIKSHHGM